MYTQLSVALAHDADNLYGNLDKLSFYGIVFCYFIGRFSGLHPTTWVKNHTLAIGLSLVRLLLHDPLVDDSLQYCLSL
jgi:hypothetical protein